MIGEFDSFLQRGSLDVVDGVVFRVVEEEDRN